MPSRTAPCTAPCTAQLVAPPTGRAAFLLRLAACLVLVTTAATSRAEETADPPAPVAESAFEEQILPFLETHCFTCHGEADAEGGIALESYQEAADIERDSDVWETVVRVVSERQMPPAEEFPPGDAEIATFVAAVRAELASLDCAEGSFPGRVTVRRLNRPEYNNTIRDLVGIDFLPAADFPSDDVGNGFDNMGDVLSLPPLLLEKYLAAAEEIVALGWADADSRRKLFPHGLAEGDDRVAVAKKNLHAFASRAFRRPVDDEEFERLWSVVRFAHSAGSSAEEAVQTGYQAVLVSPHFLFRVELGDDGASDVEPPREAGEIAKADAPAEGVRPLSDWQIASRLSYFLWSSMPDETLFELAERGRLREPSVLLEQVDRMLDDPRSVALVDNFAGQWLQLRQLSQLTPDAGTFPTFDDSLRSAMRRETELFFEALLRDDRSILEFLSADFTFVNGRLAAHYGIEGVQGDSFQRVSLPSGRRGVLTQASILMLSSNPTRTSPVKRGKWVLDNILGEPPPPPPPGVESLDEGSEVLGSLRERMEQHRSNDACAVCHVRMDAIGFGLENFDPVGAWRDRDGRFAIDPSGTLPGGLSFDGPAELMEILLEQKQDAFCRCLTKKMLAYALGRGIVSQDRCTVNGIVEAVEQQDYRFRSLIKAIVTSDPFLFREVKETL